MKNIYRQMLLAFLPALLLIACPNENNAARTGKVTFFNESSYRVNVRRDAFSGIIIVEALASGGSKTEDVRVSDNHGVGTVFSIEYFYHITDESDAYSGEIFANGIDLNVQIKEVIEENRHITIQIPQPTNLEFRTSFIKILNAHNIPVQLRNFGSILSQAGNGLLPIPANKIGIYSLSGIPAGGEFVFSGFNVGSVIDNTPIPAFTAQNGFIYCFIFNGRTVTRTRHGPAPGIPCTGCSILF
jgi:hypothetical protein